MEGLERPLRKGHERPGPMLFSDMRLQEPLDEQIFSGCLVPVVCRVPPKRAYVSFCSVACGSHAPFLYLSGGGSREH